LASISVRVVLISSTVEFSAANSDFVAAVALRDSTIDWMLVVILVNLSNAESKMAISAELAVVALIEYRMDPMVSIAAFNESSSEFRALMFASTAASLAVTFASRSPNLPLRASTSARTSSRVADWAKTVKAPDEQIAADTIDDTMKAARILDNVLLCIFVSPYSTRIHSADAKYTYVPSPALKKFAYKPPRG
jgi:hypothetical protein